MLSNSLRGRRPAALLAGLAMLATGASITTSPATSAEPAGDCATPFPAADVAAGDAVTTLTVVKGTTPIEFSGEILGTIQDGIAPGLDMIMADFGTDAGGTEIDRVGIWQGMSGSPVYAEDGRLIGAVAYGLSWGSSPVAGITPFEDMDDYLGAAAAPGKVAVDGSSAKKIAAATDVTAAQASEGFRQLPMPMGVSGVSQSRLQQMKKKGPDYLHLRGASAAGAASAATAAGPETLVAGGNLGAAISYGDITAGGVGTVTSVCDGRLVGFGHPMTYGGKTTLGLMPAEAVYVQADSLGAGFKVANMGLPAGTIDQDRLTGISGAFGALPPETDVSSTVTYGTRSRTGQSASLVPDYNPNIVFSQILANHDRVVDAVQPGTEVASYSVVGSDAAGAPFEISFTERYTSEWDIAFEAVWEIADITWLLSSMEGVEVDSITATADVTDSAKTWRVSKVQQKRGGEWVTVGRRSPAVVTPGGTLRLRTLMTSGEQTQTLPLTLEVPQKATRRGYLQVEGGASMWDESIFEAETPSQLKKAVDSRVRNDELAAALVFFGRGVDKRITEKSEPQDLIVTGGKFIDVKVRR